MRLVFPNGEHDPVDFSVEKLVVGSASTSNIQLKSGEIAPRHALFDSKKSGIVELTVVDGADATTVNKQAITNSIHVSAGDSIQFGPIHCRLVDTVTSMETKPKQSFGNSEGLTRVRMAVPDFMLRGVSGKTLGRKVPLHGITVVGRGADCELTLAQDQISRHHARLQISGDVVKVEDLGSSNGTFLNGKRVKTCNAVHGDELSFDTIRFQVQKTGLPINLESSVASEAAAATTNNNKMIIVGAVLALMVVIAGVVIFL